jgi:lipopolysaccharide export system protein LptA
MFQRILRSTIALAAVIAAYEAYVTFAVPQMEPPLATRKARPSTEFEREDAAQGPTKYQRLLAHYFPPEHWSQQHPPKVFANGTEQTMLVIDDYTRRPLADDKQDLTQVEIKRFALLIFPTPPHGDVAAPRDAIILEAQQGAKLVFDDFHPEMGRIGQITRGEFPGPIIIHSDMKDPGPDDDLSIETSDLQMNTKLLYTTAPVRFRMGQNVGGGRELEIRFLADEHSTPRDANGLKIAGFDTLEIRREVRMRMQLNAESLVPGGEKQPKADPSAQANNPAKPLPPKPPVDVTCNGPFTFDFVRYVASVDRDVVVRQLNPDGPADQLTCNQLDIHFAPKAPAPDAKPEPIIVDSGKRQQHDLSHLEAAAIIALGHPAIAISPAKKVEARGERIHIALREQRLRIEGGNDTRLTSGANVLQAPVIDYQQPEKDAASQVGRFRATGPGSLHYVADATKPDQVFQAAWQTSVQLDRDKGQPVIVMEGRPEMAFAAAGSLSGDQIRLYLRELDGTATAGVLVSGSGGDKQKQTRLAPDRLIALGNVEIGSPQMAGRTQQLVANFQLQPEAPPISGAAGAQAAAAGKASPAGPAAKANAVPKNNEPPQQTYQVVADQMQLEVILKGQAAVPATLNCNGNIIVRGVPQPGDNQQPVEVRGQQLFVDKLDTKTPHITLRGTAAGTGANIPNGDANQLAQLSGRGTTLSTKTVEIEGRENHMWSDGPGEATVLMAKDLQGNATATPTPVKITWQNGLRFDGQTIMFNGNVIVASADTTLKCDRMLARLAAPLRFGERFEQSAASFSQIDCEGLVTIENLTRDAGGLTAHDRMQLSHLSINQQTGDIRGQGPGVIRSTRFGNSMGPTSGQSGKSRATVTPADASGSKLHFLRVDFHTSLDGNIYTRELTFHDRVRCIYGPVDAWEQELELTRPESLPMESITLTCDELRLNEDPAAARAARNNNNRVAQPQPMGAIEMHATSNVHIEGQSAAQGQFTIQADRASYDKAKEQFILEGNTVTPAKLWRRTVAGDSPPYEATKIYYNRRTGEAKANGIQYLEITPGDVEKARRQPAVPPTVR